MLHFTNSVAGSLFLTPKALLSPAAGAISTRGPVGNLVNAISNASSSIASMRLFIMTFLVFASFLAADLFALLAAELFALLAMFYNIT